MRANTIWGFTAIAVALFIWWAQSLGIGKEWAPWMWFGIGACAAGAVFAWLLPVIAGTQSLELAAHELDLYNADPAIQAFREQRAKDIKEGTEPQDMVLGMLVILLITQTAWGRWQAKQHNQPFPFPIPVPSSNRPFLRMAESHLLHQLEQGKLAARGFYNGNSNDIRFISPDWWGRVYIEVADDMRQIYKATIKPRDKVDPAVCRKFTGISCELGKFFALFPKEDEPPREALEPEHP